VRIARPELFVTAERVDCGISLIEGFELADIPLRIGVTPAPMLDRTLGFTFEEPFVRGGRLSAGLAEGCSEGFEWALLSGPLRARLVFKRRDLRSRLLFWKSTFCWQDCALPAYPLKPQS